MKQHVAREASEAKPDLFEVMNSLVTDRQALPDSCELLIDSGWDVKYYDGHGPLPAICGFPVLDPQEWRTTRGSTKQRNMKSGSDLLR